MALETNTSLTSQLPETLPWWRVLTYVYIHPTVESYENLLQDPKASGRRVVLWMFLGNLIGTFFLMLMAAAFIALTNFGLSEINRPDLPTFWGMLAVVFAFELVMITGMAVVGLLTGTGILQMISKAFGGSGSYSKLLYLIGAITIPPTLLNMIPFINLLVTPVAWYGLYLEVVAVKTIHRLSWGKASAVVLIPVVVTIVMAVVFFFLYFLFFFVFFSSQFPEFFPDIIQNLSAFAP